MTAKRLLLLFTCGSAGVFGYYNHKASKKSTLFIGETREFEKEFNEKNGIPATEVMKALGQFSFSIVIFTALCDSLLPKKVKIESVIEANRKNYENLNEKYPKLFVGYVGLAWIEKSLNNLSQAHAYLMKAYQIAEANPSWTEPLRYLLPADPNYFFTKKYDFPTKFEQVTSSVWAIAAPYVQSEILGPTIIQSSLVRLQDGNSLVLINPTDFTAETIAKINSLGEVKAIITPTQPHGSALEKCYSYWPGAEIYGTSPSTKHDQPFVPWTGFLTPKGIIKDHPVTSRKFKFFSDTKKDQIITPVWKDEISYQPLEGNAFEEIVLYHKASKSALGFTDTVIYTDQPMDQAPWLIASYFYALGLKKSANISAGAQSYHLLATFNESKLKSSLEKVLENEVEHIIFGHGGIVNGKDQCEKVVRDGFDYAFNAPPISPIERGILVFRWFKQFNPFPTIFAALKYNLSAPPQVPSTASKFIPKEEVGYEYKNFVNPSKVRKE